MVREDDICKRITLEAMRSASSRATSIQGADELGWRPYFFRQFLHKDRSVCSAPGQEALVELANRIVSGKVPEAAGAFLFA